MSAYAEADHWHFVTYGLTELFGEEWDPAEISGLGYELTMRAPREPGEQPSDWPFALLASVAAAARGGHDFAVGVRLQVGGPITGAPVVPAIADLASLSCLTAIRRLYGKMPSDARL